MEHLTNDIAVGWALLYTVLCICLVLWVEIKAQKEES